MSPQFPSVTLQFADRPKAQDLDDTDIAGWKKKKLYFLDQW